MEPCLRAYSWYADGDLIAGEEEADLLITEDLIGKKLTAELTYSDANGYISQVSSIASDTVAGKKYALQKLNMKSAAGSEINEVELFVTQEQTSTSFKLNKLKFDGEITTYELVWHPDQSTLEAINFDITSDQNISNFQLAETFSNWSSAINTNDQNIVKYAGYGDVDNTATYDGDDSVALATFEVASSASVNVSNLSINGTNPSEVSFKHVETVTSDTLRSHLVEEETDVFVFAEKVVDAESRSSIGAYDALQALRLAVGLTKSDGNAEWQDFIAADINKDGKVRADDALNILKYAVGLPDAPAADWVFLDPNFEHTNIDRANTHYSEGVDIEHITSDIDVELMGVLVGDVDGSYWS